MKTLRLLLRRRLLTAVAFFSLLLAMTGCGSGFKTVPVSGKIFVNGEPLKDADATVLFQPDTSKGNKINLDFAGTLDEDGTYTLYHGNGRPGVAPGWYKVAVVATELLEPRKPDKKTKTRMPGKPVRKTLIDMKYSVAATSGIEIEVVENPAPEAYDLKLKGPAKK